MNLFELQENLKNFSQDQLVNEMRNPSGSAPQYLILSELQRRRRIMNEEQAQMPQQASVAEEAVAAAGMPQGGLAQMAQAMAPQTDMVQNTARMAEGGKIRRNVYERNRPRDEGEDDFRGLYDHYMAPPEDEFRGFAYTERMAAPERERDPFLFLADDPFTSSIINARAAMRTRADERYEADLRDALSSVGSDYEGMGARERSLREEDDDMRDMIESLMRSQSETVGGFAEGGVVRMQPGGLAGISRDLRTYMNPRDRTTALLRNPLVMQQAEVMGMTPEEYAASLSRSRADALVAADLANQADLAAMSRAAEDRMMFGETPIGAIQSERTEEPMDETLRRILENSEAAISRESAIGMTPESTYDAVPFARPRLSQPDLRDEERARRTAEYNARNLAADAQRMGLDLSGRIPREAPEILPSIPEDINRARFADIPTGALPASDLVRFGETPVGDLRPELSGVGSQIRALTRRPVPGMGDDADVAAGSAGRAELRGQGSLDGLFDRESLLDPRAERARTAADEAAAAELESALLEGPDMGGFLSTPAGSLPAASEAEDREREMPQTDGAGGGGAGGGAGGGMSGDDLYDQDKWLALAQFGLSLMSSRAPTLGQAIGEAGATGIAALRQAREDQQDREAAEQARADRLAAAAARASTRGGLTASNLVSRINSLEGDQRQLLVAISNARNNPEAALLEGGPDVSSLEQMFLNNQLELERLRSSLGGAYDVGSEEVFDATGS